MHAPSQHELVPLQLDAHIRLLPGQSQFIYIHSFFPGNEAIVCTCRSWNSNSHLSIQCGSVHTTNTAAFSTTVMLNNRRAQYSHKSFFRQIDYNAVYPLWSLTTRYCFGPHFHTMIIAMLSCQKQSTSPMSILPHDILLYILSMCPWDWVNDTIPSTQQNQQTQSDDYFLQPGDYIEDYERENQDMSDNSDQSYESYMEERYEWFQRENRFSRFHRY